MSSALWMNSTARHEDEEFLERYLKKGDVFVDIGANIGSLTLLAASRVSADGKVFSFEPHPKIYTYLNKNVALNHFRSVYTYNVALGNAQGSLAFTNQRSDDMNNIVAQPETSSIQIAIKKLDDVIHFGQQIALIKIDVEGYEKFVLEGARRILSQTLCIYFESSEWHFERYNYSSTDLFRLIRDYDFKIFQLKTNRALVEIDVNHISVEGENLVAIKDLEDFKLRTGYCLEET